MPGRVIDLVTKVGEQVKAGQKLLVTEAMKLETVIKAPDHRDGARDRRRRRRERRGRRPAGRHRRGARRREAVSFRRARRGEARACSCPTARASTRRRSASDWNERVLRAGRTGSRALARWVAARTRARGAARAGRTRALASAVARPSKLVCIGLNYRDHARESGAALPGEPIVFLKATSALAGARGRSASCPRGGEKTDWEVELALVIGARAKYVDRRGRAGARRRLRRCTTTTRSAASSSSAHGQWTKGKSADGFAPLGPFLVHAADELARLRVGAAVAEGQRRDQAGRQHRGHDLRRPDAGQLRVAVHDAAAGRRDQHRARPPGVGLGHKPPVYLRPGDVVEYGVDGLGQARQRILAAE